MAIDTGLEAITAFFSSNTHGDLLKVVLFVLVQALVYLILSKSSDVFSKSAPVRSASFKPARSLTIRRFLAAVADMPSGGEPSPSAKDVMMKSPGKDDRAAHEHAS